MEIKVKETRGPKAKYDFTTLELGSIHLFRAPSTSSLLTCAKIYAAKHGLDWKFRCYTEGNLIAIVRVK